MMSQNIKHQSGAILVVSLVMLLVMTLMGVTSMSITTSELKIASNQQAHNDSYEAAFSMLHSIRNNTPMDENGWMNIDNTLPITASIAETSFTGAATMTYDHCLRGNAGNSLTIESQDGDSASALGRVVQEIVATGTAVEGVNVLANTTMVNGISASVAYCPN